MVRLAGSSGEMQILVADDEPDVRLSMKMLLELQGHHVDVACNGREAVELAVKTRPDVVLMDLSMPVMDGLTATEQLHEQPQTSTIPVIAFSAYMRETHWRAKAFKAGCKECLPKPLDLDALDAALARLQRH
jgi:CheY-like chemotaxis protein